MEDTLLSITGLCKQYRGFQLKDVGLSVPAGQIVGLVGANGSGKTTTIRCMLGAKRPDAGSIRLLDEEVSPCSPGFVGPQRFAQIRQQVGYVPDTCAFPEEASVKDVGTICSHLFESWDQGRFAMDCQNAGLAQDKHVKELSRGMGMRLSLACALAHTPRLLVLDEATAGLDPLAREEVLDLLLEYVADTGAGVLMSSHITSDLERISDRIVCMDAGRVQFDMETAEITDLAGIATCREHELQQIIHAGLFEPETLRIRREAYCIKVLVPDRVRLSQQFPQVNVERASMDAYLALFMKGERL